MNRQSGKTAGKALKKIFRQDDIFGKIEAQPANFSLLMNPTRLEIFIHLCQNPCDHTRSIAREVKTSLSTVNWHLGQLLEYGYLEAMPVKGRKLYWPRGMVAIEDAEMIGCLRHGAPPGILRIISRDHGVRQRTIVESMHMKQQNIDFWLNRMVECKLIHRNGRGMGVTFHISEYLAGRMIEYDNSARSFSRNISELFRNDGLMPKDVRFRNTRLGVDIKLPTGRRRIHLECSPLASVRAVVVR